MIAFLRNIPLLSTFPRVRQILPPSGWHRR